MRERLLASVRARTRQAMETGDAGSVLAPEAVTEAGALLARVLGPAGDSDGSPDLEVLHAVGLFYWQRVQGLPADEWDDDLQMALVVLQPVYEVDPGAVPELLRTFYSEQAPPGPDKRRRRRGGAREVDPGAVIAQGDELLDWYLQNGDLDALQAAIRLYRAAMAAVPDGGSEHDLCLSRLYLAVYALAEETGDVETLREATNLGRAALGTTGDEDVGRVRTLSSLGGALQLLWEHTGDCEALEEAVTVGRMAVTTFPAGDPNQLVALANLGVSLRELFEHTQDVDLLHEAVAAHRQVVAVTPDGHPSRASRLTNLGNTLRVVYERTSDADALAEAVAVNRAAVAGAADDQPSRAVSRSNLATALVAEFERSGDLGALREAVVACLAAIAELPDDHSAYARFHSNLGISLRLLFEQTGDFDDLHDAIGAGQAAVAVTPEGHLELADFLSGWGATLRTTFEQASDQRSLSRARAALAAVAATPSDSRADLLADLAGVLRARYRRTRDLGDLDTAVQADEWALTAAPAGSPARVRVLSNLGITLLARFEHTGVSDDLDAAVSAGERAVAEADGHPARASMLANLGDMLRRRFERNGSRSDLDNAVLVAERAVAAAPDEVVPLANLSLCLRTRYGQTGEPADLDRAVLLSQRALAALVDGDVDRPVVLTGLATALRARFERTGELADAEAAVHACEQALAAIPDGLPEKVDVFATLATVSYTRFTRTRDRRDVELAVAAGVSAANGVTDGHVERARYLANLSVALLSRFDLSDELSDLDAAVATAERAAALTGEGHHARASNLSNLALTLKERFMRTKQSADLDAAIQAMRLAVDATPDGHPQQAGMLSNLAGLLRTQYQHRGDPADLDAAVEVARRGARVPSSAPRARIGAAVSWAKASAAVGRWREAVDAYTAVMDLVGHMSLRSLGRSDQEGVIADLSGLGTTAAACCVQAGMPERAVELSEQGRAVLLGYSLDGRTDLTELVDAHPALAQRFVELRDELNGVVEWDGSAPAAGGVAAGLGGRRVDLATAFDDLVREIQALPGFESFLAPPSIAALRQAAIGGPVVLVNVAAVRSDALIATAEGVLEPVPLPGLTPESLRDQTIALFEAVGALPVEVPAGPGAEERLRQVLGWLWDNVTGPVLDRLGFTGPPPMGPDGQPDWPRVWWCPSGLLSFLPLHASGHHDRAGGEAVMDRVLSSYTPTLRALGHARQSRPPAVPPPQASLGAGQLLAVAMRQTPGYGSGYDLPAVAAEIELLRDLFSAGLKVLSDGEALRRDVLDALPDARWVHFACHARADLEAPSTSRLLLSDWADEPLTVADIARVRLDNADLAFLSACSTARGGLMVSDEAVHLGNAFQLAGFRHVIATLWAIEDDAAAAVARDTYRRLRAAGSTDQAALALHNATRALRRRSPAKPSWWAAHVHVGI